MSTHVIRFTIASTSLAFSTAGASFFFSKFLNSPTSLWRESSLWRSSSSGDAATFASIAAVNSRYQGTNSGRWPQLSGRTPAVARLVPRAYRVAPLEKAPSSEVKRLADVGSIRPCLYSSRGAVNIDPWPASSILARSILLRCKTAKV